MNDMKACFNFIFLLACILVSAIPPASAQSAYDVSSIDPKLMEGANAVLRTDETFFEIKSKAEAVMTRHYVVTILNEKGEEEYNEPVVGYGPFVMNSDEEVAQAMDDFRSGRFGRIAAAERTTAAHRH